MISSSPIYFLLFSQFPHYYQSFPLSLSLFSPSPSSILGRVIRASMARWFSVPIATHSTCSTDRKNRIGGGGGGPDLHAAGSPGRVAPHVPVNDDVREVTAQQGYRRYRHREHVEWNDIIIWTWQGFVLERGQGIVSQARHAEIPAKI